MEPTGGARVRVGAGGGGVLAVERDRPGLVAEHDPVALRRLGHHPHDRSHRDRVQVQRGIEAEARALAGSRSTLSRVPSARCAGHENAPFRASGIARASAWSMCPALELVEPDQPAEQRQAGRRRAPVGGVREEARVASRRSSCGRPRRRASRPRASPPSRTPTWCPWRAAYTTMWPSVPAAGCGSAGIGTCSHAAWRSGAGHWESSVTRTLGWSAGTVYTGVLYWVVLMYGGHWLSWRCRSAT